MRGAGVGWGNQKFVSGSNKFEKPIRHPSRDVSCQWIEDSGIHGRGSGI